MLHSELMHMLMLYNYDCTLTVYKEKQYPKKHIPIYGN